MSSRMSANESLFLIQGKNRDMLEYALNNDLLERDGIPFDLLLQAVHKMDNVCKRLCIERGYFLDALISCKDSMLLKQIMDSPYFDISSISDEALSYIDLFDSSFQSKQLRRLLCENNKLLPELLCIIQDNQSNPAIAMGYDSSDELYANKASEHGIVNRMRYCSDYDELSEHQAKMILDSNSRSGYLFLIEKGIFVNEVFEHVVKNWKSGADAIGVDFRILNTAIRSPFFDAHIMSEESIKVILAYANQSVLTGEAYINFYDEIINKLEMLVPEFVFADSKEVSKMAILSNVFKETSDNYSASALLCLKERFSEDKEIASVLNYVISKRSAQEPDNDLSSISCSSRMRI